MAADSATSEVSLGRLAKAPGAAADSATSGVLGRLTVTVANLAAQKTKGDKSG